jgi:hypothetical protein
MFRRSYIYWTAPFLALMLLFGGSGAAPQAAAQATPAATASGNIAAESLTFGPGSFNLQRTAGLAELSGYQASLRVDFKGKEGGQASPWTETFDLLASGKPAARALTATFKGKAPAAEYVPLWSATMNGALYRRSTDGSCIASVIQEGAMPVMSSPVWEPADFLPDVSGVEDAGAKTVNGVAAKGYKFDERALGAEGRAKATGEVWVADPGGYIVKYNLTLNGGAEYFGDGGEGTLTWAYTVTKVGQPAAIKLLKDCPEGLVDAALMADAEDVERYPGATLYRTSSTIAQVADFYVKNLPTAGWKATTAPIIEEKMALLNFKQGTLELTVYITVDDNGTVVRLMLDSPAQ